ncbi:hypothetical protein [Phenylobacterium sp. J367]|uniref:hypothetical protein n=1 Tax=Phenylobacterium sp. J367 TaxID=2898435 RepID=UPI002151EA72|nr:hypothetical protein [Phenylobacterium sp. J367]MCR5879367.1 hypothetical protein [Phenylobacterium sp. J367]
MTGQPAAAKPEPINDPLLAPAQEAVETMPAAPLEPPASRGEVARAEIQPPARRTEDFADAADGFRAPPAWPVYLTALAVSVLWAVGPIAFAVGYRNRVAPLTEDMFALAVFALLAIGPAIFVWGCAYMIRQGQKLGAEARRAKAMAEDMLSPAMVAAARAGHVVQAVRDEITAAGLAADQARETLMALRQAVADETLRLTDATRTSVRTAQDLAGTLGKERTEIATLADSLDARAAQVADTIGAQALRVVEASDAAGERLRIVEQELAQTLDNRVAKITEAIGNQARMVAEAADVAEAQLREAEGVMAARAADLAAAAGEVGDAARTAGEDLTRHIARLETAGAGVADQVKAVEGGLIGHRTALVTLSQALKADHSGFAAEAEAHAAQLGEFISQARLSAAEMNERAMRGSETLKALMADAAEQFRDLAETARAEREEFGQSTLQSLDAVSSAAAEQRLQLESPDPRGDRRARPRRRGDARSRRQPRGHRPRAGGPALRSRLQRRPEGQPGVRGEAGRGPRARRAVVPDGRGGRQGDGEEAGGGRRRRPRDARRAGTDAGRAGEPGEPAAGRRAGSGRPGA